MKHLRYLSLILCFVTLFALTGCSKEYGGIINSFKVDGDYIELSFSEHQDVNYYLYPIMYIYESDFEEYGCKNLNELVNNEDFKNSHKQCTNVLVVEKGQARRNQGKKEIKSLAYWLFYEGMQYNEAQTPDSFLEITDLTNYIGYIKF